MKKSDTVRSVAQDWLSFQCRVLHGVSSALVLLADAGQQQFSPAASWSNGKSADAAALTETARMALQSRRPIIGELGDAHSPADIRRDIAAMPLLSQGQLLGVVAFEVQRPPDVQQRVVMNTLQLGVAWLEFLINQHNEDRSEELERALRTVAATLDAEAPQAAMSALVTTLAVELGCERVSVGMQKGRHCRLQAISHSARFDKRANLVRDLEAAMDEALEQDQLVGHPAIVSDAPALALAQRELSTKHGGHAVLSVPLAACGRLIGALTFERASDKPFDDSAVRHCRDMAELLAPLLELQRKAAQPALARAASSAVSFAGNLLTLHHRPVHYCVAALIATAAWLLGSMTDFEVAAPAALEGAVQQVVVAPRDGYIGVAMFSAGDTVQAGETLATLDDKDLQLELIKWQSERDQYGQKHRELMAKRDLGSAAVVAAQIAEAEARIGLVNAQLARSQLQAPFAGVVVKGDLKHSLGAPVKRGDVLFEIAPLDAYNVVIEVDEQSIAAVQAGQSGHVVLTAMPAAPVALTISKVTPVTDSTAGRNTFRVEASLDDSPAELRPGMHGIAKIQIEPRRRIWIWTHALFDWLRLKTWAWWPN